MLCTTLSIACSNYILESSVQVIQGRDLLQDQTVPLLLLSIYTGMLSGFTSGG